MIALAIKKIAGMMTDAAPTISEAVFSSIRAKATTSPTPDEMSARIAD